MAEAKRTTSHDKILKWVEKRGGKPACVRGTGGKEDTGVLRIDFPGYSGADSLQPIEWNEFFQKFEEQNLAFLYQDKTASGRPSNFNKLVSRDRKTGGAKGKSRGKSTTRATSSRAGGASKSSSGTTKAAPRKKAAASKSMSAAARKGTTKKAAKGTKSAGGRANAASSRRK